MSRSKVRRWRASGGGEARRRPTGTLTAVAAVVAGAMLWGTTGTAQALAPAGAESAAIGSLRAVVGGALLAALLAMRGADVPRSLTPRDIARPAVIAGAVSIVAYQLCFFAAVRAAGVAVGTLVAIGSVPVLTGLAQTLVRRRRPDLAWFAATALALVGTVLLVVFSDGAAPTDPRARSAASTTTGVMLAVGAGASYTVLTFATKSLMDDGWTPRQAVGYSFGLGGLVMLPILFRSDIAWLLTPRGVAVTAWLGFAATAVAYVLFARGLRTLEPATVGTLTLAEPLTAATLGLTVLGERPGGGALAGAGLVLLGLVVVAAAPLIASSSRRSSAASSPHESS